MIGIIFPAYNEEKNIKGVIEDAKKYLPNSFILVVDDGSTDRTYEIAKKCGVKVIRHKVNRGKAEAIKTGLNFLLKKGIKIFVLADADGQYRLNKVSNLIKPILKGEADFVMGCRNWKEVPYRHRLGNLVWRSTFNFLFGTKFRDTNCGFVAMNRRAARIIKKRIYGGYILENSMLIACLREGLRIKQVPVEVHYKRKRGLEGIRIVLGVLIFIIRQGIKFRWGRSSARESAR